MEPQNTARTVQLYVCLRHSPYPGTELSYTQVDDTYYWVDDVNSRYYNQFVTTKTTPKAWNFPADAFLFRKTR